MNNAVDSARLFKPQLAMGLDCGFCLTKILSIDDSKKANDDGKENGLDRESHDEWR